MQTEVLFISYYFPPAGGSAVQRAKHFVQYLPAEGFLPIVVAGPASLDDRWTPDDPTLMSGIPPAVTVHRVAGQGARAPSRFRGRLDRWFGFPSAFQKGWTAQATELGQNVMGGARLIFATMSPFESSAVASELSRRFEIPWVADLRDPWALDDVMVYPTFVHRRLEMAKMERRLSTASVIIMNTPAAAEALRSASKRLRGKRIVSLTNGFDHQDFAARIAPRADGKFRIVHSGGMLTDLGRQLQRRRFHRLLGGAVVPGVDLLGRSAEFFLKALEQWITQRPGVSKDLDVVFAGRTTLEDLAAVKASKVSAFARFTGFLPHPESLALIRTADLLLLVMHGLPSGRRCRMVQGKTYEYIASGRPILAAVPEGDARDFLDACGTGLVCNPNDVSGMCNILDKVYLDWKEKRLSLHPVEGYASQFERRSLTHNLADIFRSIITEGNGVSEKAGSFHKAAMQL